MKKDNSGSAFPRPYSKMTDPDLPIDEFMKEQLAQKGMSLREWYAGMALQGLLSNTVLIASMGQVTKDAFSKWAFMYADAMLEEGEK